MIEPFGTTEKVYDDEGAFKAVKISFPGLPDATLLPGDFLVLTYEVTNDGLELQTYSD